VDARVQDLAARIRDVDEDVEEADGSSFPCSGRRDGGHGDGEREVNVGGGLLGRVFPGK
jgi:hypothetical protein